MGIIWNSGLQQQTPAVQLAHQQVMRRAASPKRRAKKASSPKRAKRSKKRAAGTKRAKPARLKKGSAAAKAYMAKIRRKRA